MTVSVSLTRPLPDLATEVAASCLARLQGEGALADEEAVHEMRVATKRLRAAWKLVSDLAGSQIAKTRRHALTELSGKLSGARDLSVLTKLAQHLAAKQTDGRIAMAFDHIVTPLIHRHDLALEEARKATALEGVLKTAWEEEIEAWRSLDREHTHELRRAIRHELRKSLHRARRDTREALRSLDSELWHDWRKTVKRLRYQREFVAAAQSRAPGKFDTRIHRLGSRLGERNDLTNLTILVEAFMLDGELPATEHAMIRKAIAVEEASLIGNCRRLGRQTFLR
ncbi:MAG: CHAD domain-containing protein [Verrucomicrobiae bacterium]|nr:CHAD domain-containing protein [Verrucomicrobiae bacterium]